MIIARSRALRELAEGVAAGLPPSIEEIVLTGSTSRGVADEHSDVELLLVLDELPPLADCVGLASRAGLADVDTWTPPGAAVYWSGGTFDGEFVELIWWPRAYVEERIDDILSAAVFDHARVRTAEALVNGIAVRTSGGFEEWQRRLATYPEELVTRIVDDAAETWHDLPRSYLNLLRPGEGLVLSRAVVDDAEAVLRILFAVNRAWEPGWKWVTASLAALELKPERTAERIEAALAARDLRALRELVRDALALAPATVAVTKARTQNDALLAELG